MYQRHLCTQKRLTYRNKSASFFSRYRMDLLKVWVSSNKRIVWGTLQVGDRRVGVLGKRQGLPYIITNLLLVHVSAHTHLSM